MEKNTAELVLEIVVEASGVTDKTLGAETTFGELGMDSLDFMEMMADVSVKIKQIPKSRYFAIDTIGDLLKELEAA